MNILFLTICSFKSIKEKNIYTDLLREFIKNNHEIYVVSPVMRSEHINTNLKQEGHCHVLNVKTGNIFNTNMIEKGISTILVEGEYKKAIKKHFSHVKFDLIMYSTPPITFAKVIEYVKNRDNAKSYLLLKDIFPQNAVDLGMFSKSSPIYKMFRKKEIKLYRISDYIGCMSQANVDYTLNHNSYLNNKVVHISPNSFEIVENKIDSNQIIETRQKFSIPLDKIVFVYGGNLGKPQDIPFIIECLKDNQNKSDRFFVICGTGTEYGKLKTYVDENNPKNVLLINGLPKDDYESFIRCCDVGLIFLDHRFTIPNFPSRLLSYMQNKMPIIACTDPNTDIGDIITQGNFGWWCQSSNPQRFTQTVDLACNADLQTLGNIGYEYLMAHYTVENSYNIITKNLKK